MTTSTNPIAVAAKTAARKALISKSYGLKKGKDARAAAQKRIIAQSYKDQARTKIIANWVAEKVKANYASKRTKSVRTKASAEVVAG